MAADSTALKTAYTAEIATIGDTLQNARATYALDAYTEALDALNGIMAGKVQSYSVGNRSFTYNTTPEFRRLVDGMEAQLVAMIYGTVVKMDMNTHVAQPVPTGIS